MSAIWKRLDEKEEGFTLIELLVVVIIIGILAAIAIPVFLNQRQSAWRSAAESDVRNAAIMVETYYTENREYPAEADVIADVEWSQGIEAQSYEVGGGVFCITAEHEELDGTPDAAYDSGQGGVQTDLSNWTCSTP